MTTSSEQFTLANTENDAFDNAPTAQTVTPGTITFSNLGELSGTFISPVQDGTATNVDGSGLDATFNTSGGSGGVIQATASPFPGDGGANSSDNTLQFQVAPDSVVDDVRLTSTDGTEFQLDSMVIGAVVSNAATVTVLGFRDGVQVASITYNTNTNTVGNSVDGNRTVDFDDDWNNIDEIRISISGADIAGISVDDLVVAAAEGGNDAPKIAGTPTDVTVVEDTASNLDLSSVSLVDTEGDPITLTITVDAGTFGTPADGAGVGAGVTETLVDSTTITLVGSADDINTYLDTASNITYTAAANVSGEDQATISLTPNDGTEDGNTDTVNVDVTAVNDDPTATGLVADITATEDTASDVDLSTLDFTDVDSAGDVSVTLIVDAGTLTATGSGGVTVSGSGSSFLTLTGTFDEIETFLDTASSVQYTGATDASGEDAAALTVTANDDDGSGDVTIGTVNIDITEVNDAPTATGLVTDITVTQETASNVDLSATSFGDLDSDSVTVTLTASAGTFGAPADGAGVGAGVTETLVDATTITLVGAPADINTYLDTASNITYTGASGVSGEDAATITVTVNDGGDTGDISAGTINLDIEATVNTIIGTPGPDSLVGTDAEDRILGCEDNDTLIGGLGNDTLLGQDGNDTLFGGAGNDSLNGGNGTDSALYAGAAAAIAYDGATNRVTNDGDGGSDTLTGIEKIFGSNFADTLSGGTGSDDLSGRRGDDTITGGAESDTLRGGAGNDALDGGDGGDRLLGGDGNDIFLGGDGGDTITGASGNDIAQGGDGNDFFFAGGDFTEDDDKASGDGGSDLLGGRCGDDLLVGDGTDQFGTFVTTGDTAGNDSLFGGNGDDTLYGDHHDGTNPDGGAADGQDAVWAGLGDDVLWGGGNNDVIGGGSGDDKAWGQSGNDTIYGGSNGDDTLDGGSGNDLIMAGGDNDSIRGGDGRDVIFAGNNNDRVDGGRDSDEIYGGAGNDTMVGGHGADTLRGGKGDDVANGGSGDDVLRGQRGEDNLTGGTGNDSLFGGQDDDVLFGGDDSDTVRGDDGSDTLFGGSGDDFLFGGANDDILHAGAGNDDLSGGDGADTFMFGTDNGNDTITDFDVMEDRISLVNANSDFSTVAEVQAAATETTQDSQTGVLIDLGGGESVFIVGITIADLTDETVLV
ncbi:MAG: calcium-binding protein [Kordiimonadaceae bacterium]|nr:calcium-binding protein [Kordiimonadaceae bacterium]MBO6569875.1 calcium-binding protein [Kordiimonadaceae bacterium]MBO6966029.1 calcium-binding protein [Kordiimonadaceae bacterium]